MRRIAVSLAVLVGFAAAADAPPGFRLLKPSDLKNIQQQVMQKLDAQKIGSQQLADYGTHSMMFSHMEASGQAEIHENITDIFIIQSGEATLTVGGKMVGGKQTAPGEIRGTSIEGGVTQKMAAGDIVQIPAGTPHHTQLRPGQKFDNFIVKVRVK